MHIIAEAASILCVAFYIKGKIPRWLGTLKFAAAAVYALLPQGGGAELIATAHDEFPVLSAADELGQFEAVFSHLKGGNGE